MTPVTEPDETAADETQTPLHLPVAPISTDQVRPLVLAAAAVGAVLLAVGAMTGYAAGLGVAVVLALVLAGTWPWAGGSVTPGQTSLVLGASALLVVASAVRDDLRWVAAAVAFGVVASFFHQLLRAPGREGLVLSLLASFGGLVLVASLATMVALLHQAGMSGFVVVAMAALVAALLADLLGRSSALRPYLSVVALVAAVVVALVVAVWFDRVTMLDAAGLGAAVGTVSWSFRRVMSGQPAILGARGQVAAGLGSVFAVGAIVHLYGVIS